MNYITKIKNLKNLYNKNQLSNDDLINFISINKSFDDIEKLHVFLINQINKIHKSEISKINTKLCKNSSDAKKCLDKCEDGKIGGKIYFFSDENKVNYVFGDIHSDCQTVMEFLKVIDFVFKVQNDKNLRLIFLGDYIDRGKAGFKALELILVLKFLFRDNVFLLRGNHDGGTIISENEYKLCVGRNENTTDNDYFVASLFNKLKELNKPLDFLDKYLNFFYSLCHLAFIKNGEETVLCVHGGIPRPRNDNYEHLNKLSDLYDEKIIDDLKGSVIHNMLWSDPAEDTSLIRNTRRFYFYRTHFDNFINRFDIDKIIRGHQAFDEGYKEFFDRRLISIFSSGKCKTKNEETAYKYVLPCILMLHNGNLKIIRL